MTYDKSNILKSQKQIIIMLLREMLMSRKSLKRGFQNNIIDKLNFEQYVNENFNDAIIETLMTGDGLNNEKTVFFIEETLKENPFTTDNVIEFTSETDIVLIYRKKSFSSNTLYFIEFNGKIIQSVKTYNSFKKKFDSLIEKYGLEKSVK